MKLFLRLLLLIMMMGSAYAQSNLPACQNSESSAWTNCYGSLTFLNGQKYIGEFRNGQANGQGTYTFPDGAKYVGEFMDNKRNGQGAFYASNGSIFQQGIWADGKLIRSEPIQGASIRDNSNQSSLPTCNARGSNQIGTLYLSNWTNYFGTGVSAVGEKYVSEWRDGKFNGRGTFFYADGSFEKGIWSDGRACPGSDISRWINCFGAYKFANGDIYSGEWNDGKFNGKGIDTSSNGSKYIGDFRDHKRHGKGILYATNGSILQEGTWFNNAFIRSDLVQQVTTPYIELDKLRSEAEEAKRKQAELEQQLRLAQTTQNQPPTNTSQSNQPPPVIDQGRRIALVIGNASYSSVPKLINPTNDAREVTRALQATGFEVIRLENADLRQMQDAVRSFGSKLGKNDVGLFYFSVHGVQVKGKNYLIPVRENIKQSFEVPSSAIDADLILATMENAKNNLNIMILDACRSPFPGEARSLSRGLATLDAAKGTLIAYATAPGKEALDGQGSNSSYTKHLVRALQQKGLPIEQVFKQVRIAVVEETKGSQVPWENSSIMGDFYFRK